MMANLIRSYHKYSSTIFLSRLQHSRWLYSTGTKYNTILSHHHTGNTTTVISTDSGKLASFVKPFSEVPTPSGALPLLGHGPLMKSAVVNKKGRSQYLLECFQELGPIFKLCFAGGFTTVYISDPSAVEVLFRNEGLFPRRNEKIEELFRHFFKSSSRSNKCTFAFETGDKWRAGRSKLNKQLTTANITSYCTGFNRVTDRVLRNISRAQNDEGIVEDVKRLLIHWSFESAAYFVIGANLDTINDPRVNELFQAVDGFSKSIGRFTTSLPLYKLFPAAIPSYKQLCRSFNDMYSIGEDYVKEQLPYNRREQSLNDGTATSFLQQWLNDDNFTEEEAVKEAISLLVHALDITTNTTELILYELSKHDMIQNKLLNEVVSVLGRDEEANGDSLQRIPYLNQIIKETLRLHPVSPLRTRTLTKDITLLGYNIPAGTPVLASQVAIARNDKYFKEPHLFNPDRWTTDTIHPFAQLPFGFGPKSCWGRRFVQLQMKILLTKLSRHFLMESTTPPFPPSSSSSSSFNKTSLQSGDHEQTLIARSGPTKIKFIPRQK